MALAVCVLSHPWEERIRRDAPDGTAENAVGDVELGERFGGFNQGHGRQHHGNQHGGYNRPDANQNHLHQGGYNQGGRYPQQGGGSNYYPNQQHGGSHYPNQNHGGDRHHQGGQYQQIQPFGR